MVRKGSKCKHIIIIMFVILSVTGCQNDIGKLNGYGNSISNLNIGKFVACEGNGKIRVDYKSLIYDIDKETESVELICKDASCTHQLDNVNCPSGKFISNLQYYNGKYYYADLSFGGCFEMDKDKIRQIVHIGEIGNNGIPIIYNNRIYYRNKTDETNYNIVYKEVSNMKKTEIPVGEHIDTFYPYENKIYFTTMENRLYVIDDDGRNRKLLTKDKVSDFIPDGEDLYYVRCDGTQKGLYKMKADGTDAKIIFGETECFSLGKEYIYAAVDSFSEKGTYIARRDGTEHKKISEKKMIVGTFDNWNRVIAGYITENQDEGLVVMDEDGKNIRKLEFPETVKGE